MNEDINVILADYMDAAAQPGGTRLQDWVQRYPQYEAELVRFAVYQHVTQHSPAAVGDDPAAEARYLERVRAIRQRMMAEIGVPAPTASRPALTSLLDAASAVGLRVPELAKILHLSPPEILKLNQRLYRAASLPKALVAQIAGALNRPFDDVAAYLRLPPTLSAQASYRADSAPRVQEQEDFAESIARSRSLTQTQKAEWLAQTGDPLGIEEK
jgi:hypothetical protein